MRFDWLNEWRFQIRSLYEAWRGRRRLRDMQRRYAFVMIAPETRHFENLAIQTRTKRRETKACVYYMALTTLRPEVLAWIQGNATRGVHSITDSEGGLCLFFDAPDDAVAFRMRWM